MRAPLLVLTAAAIVATACGSSSDSTASVTPPVTTPAVSKIVSFKATMNGAGEVPANTTTGSGVFTATIDTSTNVMVYDMTFSGLTSAVNNGHIHGPAAVGVNAGTTVNFTTQPGGAFSFGTTSGSGHGTVVLTAATAITSTMNGDSLKKLMFAGLTYANIHTANNGGGEIRGQIVKQ